MDTFFCIHKVVEVSPITKAMLYKKINCIIFFTGIQFQFKAYKFTDLFEFIFFF